jgi:hypothetical protein
MSSAWWATRASTRSATTTRPSSIGRHSLDDMPEMVVLARTAGAPDSLPPMVKSISESLDPKLFPEIRQLKVLYRQRFASGKVAAVVSLIGMVAVCWRVWASSAWSPSPFRSGPRRLPSASHWAPSRSGARSRVAPVRVAYCARPGSRHGDCGSGLKGAAQGALWSQQLDPAGYAGAVAVLVAIIAVAALLPARRALHLDLAKTLHYE